MDPKDARPYGMRSDAYRELGQHQQGVEDLIKVEVNHDPKVAAVAYYERAIKAHPKDAWAYSGLGQAYLQEGSEQRAVEDCTIAVSLDPKCAIAYATRGFAYKKLGQEQKAVDDFSKAVSLDPSLAKKIALSNFY